MPYRSARSRRDPAASGLSVSIQTQVVGFGRQWLSGAFLRNPPFGRLRVQEIELKHSNVHGLPAFYSDNLNQIAIANCAKPMHEKRGLPTSPCAEAIDGRPKTY
jgi:hypothetical protein